MDFGANVARLPERPLRVLQITDSHLGSDSDETLLGINTEQSLRDVLDAITANHSHEPPFDLVVSTGDISNDGKRPSYQRFVTIVREYLPGIPLAWLDGNHDDPEGMRVQGVPQPLSHIVGIGDWRIILLSSRVPFEERGELPESELHRLEKLLAIRPESPTIVMMHHQPVPIGSAWIDQYKVANSDRFFNIIDKHPNVKGVVWGHVHQEFYMRRGELELFATPSTCVQFKPRNDDFAVDLIMPGYRVFELYDDGKINTFINRVEGFCYVVDLTSNGY
ncbi:MAG TPA: 3',5'-cyclic-AMP phosphodiesterase [Marinagarivorans sp.]